MNEIKGDCLLWAELYVSGYNGAFVGIPVLLDGTYLTKYKTEISRALLQVHKEIQKSGSYKSMDNECGKMILLVEERGGMLWGVLTCQSEKELSSKEMKTAFLAKEYESVWENAIEEKEIECADGALYIHFDTDLLRIKEENRSQGCKRKQNESAAHKRDHLYSI